MAMTPAERLIAQKLIAHLDDEDHDVTTAYTRTANELGLSRKRVVQVWAEYRDVIESHRAERVTPLA